MDEIDLPLKFACPQCGGEVAPRKGAGRFYEFKRGVPPLEIPVGLAIPECSRCHERYLSEALAAQLEAAMRKPYIVWQADHLDKVVDLLANRHQLSKAQIARLAGVTPSHLSHLLAGENDAASDTLLRLMEAFAKCSEEVERHKAGIVFDISAAPKTCWKPGRVRISHQVVELRCRIEDFSDVDNVLDSDGWETTAKVPKMHRAHSPGSKGGHVS